MARRQKWAIAFIVLAAVLVFEGWHQASALTADQQSCEKDSSDVVSATE